MFRELDLSAWAYGDRDFSLWAVSPSLQRVLLRSNARGAKPGDLNVDVLFYGVSAMFMSPHLRALRIEVDAGGSQAGWFRDVPLADGHTRFLLRANGFTGFVDAMDNVYVEENTHEFCESSMEFIVVKPKKV